MLTPGCLLSCSFGTASSAAVTKAARDGRRGRHPGPRLHGGPPGAVPLAAALPVQPQLQPRRPAAVASWPASSFRSSLGTADIANFESPHAGPWTRGHRRGARGNAFSLGARAHACLGLRFSMRVRLWYHKGDGWGESAPRGHGNAPVVMAAGDDEGALEAVPPPPAPCSTRTPAIDSHYACTLSSAEQLQPAFMLSWMPADCPLQASGRHEECQ